MNCACGSSLVYTECCGRFIDDNQIAETAEQLMRSRYTAYTLVNINYITSTMKGAAANNFNEQSARDWALSVDWLKLRVLDSQQLNDKRSTVEFIAIYAYKNKKHFLWENSEFNCIDGRWYYMDGEMKTAGRNDACPCGSGKKYKKCCY